MPGLNPADFPSLDSQGASISRPSNINYFAEYGTTGLFRLGPYIWEEWLPELQQQKGVRIYKEMWTNDAIISSIFYAIEMVCRSVDWDFEPGGDSPEDEQAAEFYNQCLFEDMSVNWDDTLSEILSMFIFGWHWAEIVYKKREGPHPEDPTMDSNFDDGRIGWRKLATRTQESLLRWDFDDNGGVVAMVQLAPPHYRITEIPMEKSLLFRVRPRKGSPEGTSLLRGAYRCYSEDTDILTRTGWKPIKDVRFDDEVASLNPDTNQLFYQHPTELHNYPYDGDLVHVNSRFLDMLVTPNHSMWVRHAHTDKWALEEIKDIPVTAHYKCDADWIGVEQEYFTLPELTVKTGRKDEYALREAKDIKMDDWLRFLGIWIAEGHTYRRKNGNKQATVGVSQSESSSHFGDIREWVNAIGFPVYEHGYQENKVVFEISHLQLWDYLKRFGKSHDKFVPDYVKELSPRQIRIFLDAYYAGDGTKQGHQGYGEYEDRYYNGSRLSFTVSKQLADDISELILKVGGCPRIHWKKETGFGGGIWITTEGKRFKQGCRPSRYECQEYHGNVYCVTVPEHHVIYVRRNGKSCWSGNSWYLKKNIEDIEAIGVERDLAGIPIMRVPENVLLGSDADAVSARDYYKQVITNIHRNQDEGIILPSTLYPPEDGGPGLMYDIQLLGPSSQRQFMTGDIINRYNKMIAMTVLADFLMLGQDQTGSYALAETRNDIFSLSITAILDSIAETINSYAVPRLARLNANINPQSLPKLTHGDIASSAGLDIANAISLLARGGVTIPDTVDFRNKIWNILHLPTEPEPEDAEVKPPADSLLPGQTAAPPQQTAADAMLPGQTAADTTERQQRLNVETPATSEYGSQAKSGQPSAGDVHVDAPPPEKKKRKAKR
jgi:hypothetical protein